MTQSFEDRFDEKFPPEITEGMISAGVAREFMKKEITAAKEEEKQRMRDMIDDLQQKEDNHSQNADIAFIQGYVQCQADMLWKLQEALTTPPPEPSEGESD